MNVRRGALAVVLVASSATAEDQHAFRLSYSAPPGCASREAFSAAIESNGIRAHHVGPGQAAIDVDARIEIRGEGFLGVLRIGRPDGTTTTRSLPAASCDEAASAMALVASIAIDPEAAAAASQQVPEAAAGVTPAPASAPPELPAPTAPAPIAAPAATVPADRPPAAAESEQSPARAWQLGVAGGVGLTGAIAPGVSPDYHLGFSFGATPRTLLSPLVLLSAHLAESGDVLAQEGTAQFQRIGGRLTGCPLAAKAGPLLLRPCLLFEAGQLKATGSHITPPRTTRILWLELGTTVRGELTLFGPLSLTAELGAGFPLIDDSFYFDPSGNSIHQVPPVGFLGALELGVRIM